MWATVGEPRGTFVQPDTELRRKRRDPCEHVAELVDLLLKRTFSHGLGQLADLLGYPRNGWRKTPFAVSFAVGGLDNSLQLVQFHDESSPSSSWSLSAVRDRSGDVLSYILTVHRSIASVYTGQVIGC